MWISARTALTLAGAALLLVMVAVAAPLIPRPNLPSLPEERAAHAAAKPADKLGPAAPILAGPERARVQRMVEGAKPTPGGAKWGGRSGSGPAETPPPDAIARLRALLRDARTVADPRAETAEPAYVVRLVRDDHRLDVMVDADRDRVVVARDGVPVAAFATAGLHREYADLGASLLKP